MTIKYELAAAAIAVGAAAGTWLIVDPMGTSQHSLAQSRFTQSDYAAFDRQFDMSGRDCDVGVSDFDMCFQASPSESLIMIGQKLPESLPALPASLEVLRKTSVKTDNERTYRYGRVLALVDMQTGIVVDRLDLSQQTFAAASGTSYAVNTTYASSY